MHLDAMLTGPCLAEDVDPVVGWPSDVQPYSCFCQVKVLLTWAARLKDRQWCTPTPGWAWAAAGQRHRGTACSMPSKTKLLHPNSDVCSDQNNKKDISFVKGQLQTCARGVLPFSLHRLCFSIIFCDMELANWCWSSPVGKQSSGGIEASSCGSPYCYPPPLSQIPLQHDSEGPPAVMWKTAPEHWDSNLRWGRRHRWKGRMWRVFN